MFSQAMRHYKPTNVRLGNPSCDHTPCGTTAHAHHLEDAFEDAFARGLGAGLGSGNFKFLGMKLPGMWSCKVHSQPYVTGKFVTKPMSYVAALHLVPNQN